MLEKIIEVYPVRQDGLDLSRPAFDIMFYRSGQISGKIHSDEWSDLEVRTILDISEKMRPRERLDQSSAKAAFKFDAIMKKTKLPPDFARVFEWTPPESKRVSTFEEMLEWLGPELQRCGLGFRVTTPGAG